MLAGESPAPNGSITGRSEPRNKVLESLGYRGGASRHLPMFGRQTTFVYANRRIALVDCASRLYFVASAPGDSSKLGTIGITRHRRARKQLHALECRKGLCA